MRNWLHAHLTPRGSRAFVFEPAPAGMSAALASADAEPDAELVGQVQRRNDGSPASSDASWLPPLWLSW